MTRFFSLMTLLAVLVLSPLAASATSANFLRKELDKPGVQMVVVELYATWCKPCMEAIPRWEKLRDKYRDRGVRIIMVHTQDAGTPSGTGVSHFADEVIDDPKGQLANWLGAGEALPAAFVWDWQGNLLVKNGHIDEVEAKIKSHFKKQHRVLVEATSEVGAPDPGLRDLVRTELARSGKLTVVSTEEERKAAAKLRRESFMSNFDKSTRCEIGKELAANTLLKVRPQGDTLTMQLLSADTGCLIKGASAPYSDYKKVVAVSEAVGDLIGDLKLPQYELPNQTDKKKSQFGLSLEPVFIPEIDQAPTFQPAGGDFSAVDVGFLEVFEAATNVDRNDNASEQDKVRAWMKVANYETTGYDEERRQAAERARGYQEIIKARERERAQLLQVRERYQQDKEKLQRLLNLNMVSPEQKREFQREFDLTYDEWLPRLRAMDEAQEREAEREEERLERLADEEEERRYDAMPSSSYMVGGYSFGFGYGASGDYGYETMRVGMQIVGYEGKDLGLLYGFGYDVFFTFDSSINGTYDLSRMMVPFYGTLGVGFELDVGFVVGAFGRLGYNILYDSDEAVSGVSNLEDESALLTSVGVTLLTDEVLGLEAEYIFGGMPLPIWTVNMYIMFE